MVKKYMLNENLLPLIIGPEIEQDNSFQFIYKWLSENKSWFSEKLGEHGAVLLRGFSINSIDEFSSICKVFQSDLKDYKGGNSPRTLLERNVYTSTDYSNTREIIQHQELSYALDPPRYLFFYCDCPADIGGETPITDCRIFLRNLKSDIKEKFKKKKIKYIQNLPENNGFGRTWKETFETETQTEVEQALIHMDSRFYWKDDGTLHWEQVRPGISVHPQTKEEVWLNQADQWHISQFDEETQEAFALVFKDPNNYPLYSMWEDNTEFDVEDFYEIKRLFDQLCVKNPWKKGDVLILDNLLVSHGRMPFEGDRKIFVAMG